MNARQAQRVRVRAAGLTLIEMLMALAGTGFVAAAVVAMLSGVASGTADRTNLREAVVRQKTIVGRITAAIRSSCSVLAADDDVLVLWMKDDNGDGAVNISEMRRIERHDATDELRSYKAPDDLASGDDTAYPLASTDFDAVSAALRGTARFPMQLWATGISSWTVTVDTVAVQDATLVSSRLTIDLGAFKERTLAVAALRNSGATSFISMSGGDESSESGGGGGGGGGSSKSSKSSKGKGKKGKSTDKHGHDDDHHHGKGKGHGHDDDDDHGKGKGHDDDDDDDDDHGKGKGKGKGHD